ncbi:hypothetical protein PMKS-001418 [Pichia membranifaciens]|uniref:Uncharacterized protein n=1 Tax=Pichia membranifaciens TaxID=4926 RepID=A0A1Q2YEH2_9ASCO|nr:hypothetical protein PMKS-001418 [Pichia membranifaciens]
MRVLPSVLTTTLFWCLVQTYPVKAATDEGDIICPDSNPLNCYPRLFAATHEWQVVKEGQVIPAGLNVRLDLENMNREAKLGDASGKQVPESEKKNHELVVPDGDAGFLAECAAVVEGVRPLQQRENKTQHVWADGGTVLEGAGDDVPDLVFELQKQPRGAGKTAQVPQRSRGVFAATCHRRQVCPGHHCPEEIGSSRLAHEQPDIQRLY